MTKVGECYYNGTIDKLKADMKRELEHVYSKKLLTKRQKEQEDLVYKNWDGCLDTKSSRDDKLNKLGVN